MVRISASATMALAALCAASAAGAAPFAAGQWQHQTTLLSAQVPGVAQWLIRLVAGHASRTSCNSAADLASHPETLFKGDDAAICTLRKLSLVNGRITFDTFCTNKRFPDGLLVASQGTYSATSYAIATTSTGTKDGKPVRITTQGSGQWLSATCRRP